MIDTHCHLDQPPLIDDLNTIIKRSKDIGIKKLLTISTTIDSFKKILDIIKLDPIIYGTFGIHPHETDKELLSKQEIIKNFENNNKIIGVGETGLDFYYNHSEKKEQINSFEEHINAAKEKFVESQMGPYYKYGIESMVEEEPEETPFITYLSRSILFFKTVDIP